MWRFLIEPELKDDGREAFLSNYWICVLAALILFIMLGGGISYFRIYLERNDFFIGEDSDFLSITQDEDILYSELPEHMKSVLRNSGMSEEEIENIKMKNQGVTYWDSVQIGFMGEDYIASDIMDTVIPLTMGIIVGIIVIAMILGFLLSIFVRGPFQVGACRFFVGNAMADDVKIKDVLYGYTGGWFRHILWVYFQVEIRLSLWTLLFIIPGIIKSYEYYMVPYLLAENPELTAKEAIRISKDMMYGNKWRTFRLELSFIGWDFLSAATFGIVGIFYVNPYRYATLAELYLELKDLYEEEPEEPAEADYEWKGITI